MIDFPDRAARQFRSGLQIYCCHVSHVIYFELMAATCTGCYVVQAARHANYGT